MKRSIKSCKIAITVAAPASKSFAQRALVASLLAGGCSRLTGFSLCDDTTAAIEVIRALGANVTVSDGECVVDSSFSKERYTPTLLECGESGLLARMMISVMALFDRKTTIDGRGTLLLRSFESMERPLRELGADIRFKNGRLPAKIRWGMKGGQTTIDGSGGSQVLTSILMTLPLTPRGGDLFVLDLTSKPYIDMTIDLMQAFGVTVRREGYDRFLVKGEGRYLPTVYNVEGDWSGAAFLLVAGAIAGKATVWNLNLNSLQADRRIVDVLIAANVSVTIEDRTITTSKSEIAPFCFDATDCPDLFPVLVALAVFADGVSAIKGVGRLSNKESKRAETLQEEYAKIGVEIQIEDDLLYVIPPDEIGGGSVESHGDHRIAMSLAVVGLASKNGVVINGSEAVNKSFPNFWTVLQGISQNAIIV